MIWGYVFCDPDNDRNPLEQTLGLDSYLNRDVDLSYVLYKKYWGRGYATELTKACIQFAFANHLDIQQIVAVMRLNNRDNYLI